MDSTNTSTIDQSQVMNKVANQTAIAILIQDIKSSPKLHTEEGSELLLRLSKVLDESYLKKERDIMNKYAFDFYVDISRKMGVPENLISESFTHVETYFDEKINK